MRGNPLASALERKTAKVDRAATRKAWYAAVVTAVDTDAGTITFEAAPENSEGAVPLLAVPHTVAAVQGFYPEVGSTVQVAMNDTDAIVLPGPGTLVGGYAIRSLDFESGVSGWSIDAEGNAEFNDVTLRGRLLAAQATLTESPNLFENPGFEVDTSGWTATNCALTRDTSDKRSGAASGKIVSTGGEAKISTPTGVNGIPIIPGVPYYAVFYAKLTVGTPLGFRIDWAQYDTDGNVVDSSVNAEVGSTQITGVGWGTAYYIGKIPAHEDAAFIDLQFVMVGSSNGDTAFVDDAFFGAASTLVADLLTGEHGPYVRIDVDGISLRDELDQLSSIRARTQTLTILAAKDLALASSGGDIFLDGTSVADIIASIPPVPTVQSWSPVVTQGTTTFTLGTVQADWWEEAELIHFFVMIQLGTTTAGQSNTPVYVTLPADIHSDWAIVAAVFGGGEIVDSSDSERYYPVRVRVGGTVGKIAFSREDVLIAGANYFGTTIGGAVQLDDNDQIRAWGRYRKA